MLVTEPSEVPSVYSVNITLELILGLGFLTKDTLFQTYLQPVENQSRDAPLHVLPYVMEALPLNSLQFCSMKYKQNTHFTFCLHAREAFLKHICNLFQSVPQFSYHQLVHQFS